MSQTPGRVRVHGDIRSGNCYKVKLVLCMLGIEHDWQVVDVVAGDTRTEAFLDLNPAGQIPVVELADGQVLSQSNAILWYFAEDSALVPEDRLQRARVLEWMFFEQYSHEPYIATARFWIQFLDAEAQYAGRLAENRPKGYRALAVMEQQLQRTPYLVGVRPSIADIALYAYTHVADEGGYSLQDYPAVRGWLGQVAALPGHVPMR